MGTHLLLTYAFPPIGGGIARWMAEALNRQAEPDGGIVVRHDVADPRWVVRHVLQYAGEAVLIEPRELREHVARAATRIAERAA